MNGFIYPRQMLMKNLVRTMSYIGPASLSVGIPCAQNAIPPTWKKIRQNYPILVAQEELDILKNTPGNPEYDKAQAAAKQAQDEINTSNNPQTAIDEWQSNQLFPCGNGPRRTGARLPFSLYYF